MFRQLLVPLDGSVCAEQALPWAARIARRTGAHVTLAQVLLPQVVYAPLMGPMMATERANSVKVIQQAAMAYLERIAADPSLAGVEMHLILLQGTEVHTTLSHYAETQQADLVVMSSHGATGLARWWLGSVAQRIIRSCPAPVLVVQQAATTRMEEPMTHPFSILVAVDGSALSTTAVIAAAQLSTVLSVPLPGTLHLVCVVPPLHLVQDDPTTERALQERALLRARVSLAQIVRAVRPRVSALADLQMSYEALPEKEICQMLVSLADGRREASSRQRYDLIAIATHGRSGLPRWLQGSVAERLLGATKLPLLVTHQSRDELRAELRRQKEQVAARLAGPRPRYSLLPKDEEAPSD